MRNAKNCAALSQPYYRDPSVAQLLQNDRLKLVILSKAKNLALCISHSALKREALPYRGWEKVVQSIQTEPKGYPKLYIGTARGEVCAEKNA